MPNYLFKTLIFSTFLSNKCQKVQNINQNSNQFLKIIFFCQLEPQKNIPKLVNPSPIHSIVMLHVWMYLCLCMCMCMWMICHLFHMWIMSIRCTWWWWNRHLWNVMLFKVGQNVRTRGRWMILFGLHASILEPDFNLSFGQAQTMGNFNAPSPRQVLVEVEFLFQF